VSFSPPPRCCWSEASWPGCAWAAAVKAGSCRAAAYAPVIFVPARENSTDKKMDVPSVPPMDRKNVDAADATPMSLAGTALCMASTRLCMFMPRPTPNSIMYRSVRTSGVSAPIRVMRPMPMTISTEPMTGKNL
jgi:hypothetical protein